MQDTGFGVSLNWRHFSSFLGGWFSYTASFGGSNSVLSVFEHLFLRRIYSSLWVWEHVAVCCCSLEGNE